MCRTELAALRRALPRARPVAGLTIQRVSANDASEYAKVAFASFSERGPWFRGIVEEPVRRRDVRPVAGFGNGSVLPKFRGRGIQPR